MIYLIFENQENAISALNKINDKLRSLIQNYNPDAVNQDGNIIPRNAASGALMLNAATTSSWAIVQQRLDNKWCFPKILSSYHPLLNNINILENVEYYIEEEYEESWFNNNI